MNVEKEAKCHGTGGTPTLCSCGRAERQEMPHQRNHIQCALNSCSYAELLPSPMQNVVPGLNVKITLVGIPSMQITGPGQHCSELQCVSQELTALRGIFN